MTPSVSPEVIEWTKVTEEFLRSKPEWFYGDLWCSCGKYVYYGKYDWQQGHHPDRLLGSEMGDMWAIGMYVMPMTQPKPPVV